MKNMITWYNFGAFILFLGLLWMFLPHATHNLILSSEEEADHIFHVFEGAIIAVAAIGLMVLDRRRQP